MRLPQVFLNNARFEFLRRTDSDDALVTKTLNGDLRAFENIMRRYNQRNFRIARSYVRDDSAAMDVVQNAYIQVFTKLDQYKGPNRFSLWLARVVKNEALGYLRKDNVVVEFDSDVLEKRSIPQQQQPDLNAGRKEMQSIIESCIDQLPEKFRVVFMLRAVEQLSTLETAEMLGVKPETVKTRYHRAKNLLRAKLVRFIEPGEIRAFEFAGHRCNHIVASVLEKIKGDLR